MTDRLIVSAAVGFIAGTLLGALRDPWRKWRYSRWQRRLSYSSAAIAFRATAEDAANVRSKIVNRLDSGSVQRGNGSSGPNLTDPSTDRPWFPQ